MRVAVTGARGFIGRHVLLALAQRPEVEVLALDRGSDDAALHDALSQADALIHLAGANRPADPADFHATNVGLTGRLLHELGKRPRVPRIVYSSSIHAGASTPYGASKGEAEALLEQFGHAHGAAVDIFRLPNVFGKWCRPNYNSGVATFAHNIARGIPITVNDPSTRVTLAYVDDVVAALVASALDTSSPETVRVRSVQPVYERSLGDIVATLDAFRDSRSTLVVPDFADRFIVSLYATYLSYLAPPALAYPLKRHSDERGALAELLKSPHFGQVFVSRTLPGITRGRHFHHTKTEKFVIVEGQAVVQFRSMADGTQFDIPVDGREFRVIDIPPGVAHSITNVGASDLVTLFWASEIFDPARPDTFAAEV